MMLPPVTKFLADRTGSMTVEFVATLPLLLLALVFSFEFGRALWAYDVISSDVRAATRYLARTSVLPSPPNCPPAAETEAKNIAKRGVPGGTDSQDHFPWAGLQTDPLSCGTVPYTPYNFNQPANGSVITVTARVPIAFSFMTFFNTFTNASINSSYTLVVSDQARYVGN